MKNSSRMPIDYMQNHNLSAQTSAAPRCARLWNLWGVRYDENESADGMLDRLISARRPTTEGSSHVAAAPKPQYVPDYAPCLDASPYMHGYPAATAAPQYAPEYMPMIAPPYVPESHFLPLERAMEGYGAQMYEAKRLSSHRT